MNFGIMRPVMKRGAPVGEVLRLGGYSWEHISTLWVVGGDKHSCKKYGPSYKEPQVGHKKRRVVTKRCWDLVRNPAGGARTVVRVAISSASWM